MPATLSSVVCKVKNVNSSRMLLNIDKKSGACMQDCHCDTRRLLETSFPSAYFDLTFSFK